MHEVLVNRLGGLSLPRKCVVKLTDLPDMTLNVYCGRKTTTRQHTLKEKNLLFSESNFFPLKVAPMKKGRRKEAAAQGQILSLTSSWPSSISLFYIGVIPEGNDVLSEEGKFISFKNSGRANSFL